MFSLNLWRQSNFCMTLSWAAEDMYDDFFQGQAKQDIHVFRRKKSTSKEEVIHVFSWPWKSRSSKFSAEELDSKKSSMFSVQELERYAYPTAEIKRLFSIFMQFWKPDNTVSKNSLYSAGVSYLLFLSSRRIVQKSTPIIPITVFL